MLLLRSISDSPVLHCALEEFFLTERPSVDVLLFYINRPSVIVGRNQHIAAEINVPYCQAHDIEVVRRLSGGGTVYHDYGNINYAFMTDKETGGGVLDRDFTAPIVDALHAIGIKATVGARKELLLDGYKISGTASHVTRTRQLFHGTLLHRTNLSVLSHTLQGDRSQRGKSVASVPSPVTNITARDGSSESTEAFLDRLLDFFLDYYQTEKVEIISPDPTVPIAEIVAKAGL